MLEKESHAEQLALPGSPGIPWAHVVAVALLLTGLNALKPVHMDDPSYLTYGTEFVAHPLNPYAFTIGSLDLGYANDILVPPVLPYWLGAGTVLFGDRPTLLKLWLLPFALALAWGTAFFATRMAPSLRVPLLWLCLLSPTVLPGFNFMLDVPTLALGLIALAMAIRSIERDSWFLAIGAGLLAGLAIQTKHTGIVSSAAIGVWCVLRGRPVRGVVVVAVSLAVAVGWEWLLVALQGESHFMGQFRQRQRHPFHRAIHLIMPLLTQVAGLAPAVALLGLKALGWTGRGTLAAGVAVAGAFALLALVPSQSALIEGSNGKPVLTPANLIYGFLGILVWGASAGICIGLLKHTRNPDAPERMLDWFLLIWLVLEVGGYFALSPYPAARRVISPVFVFTLVAGRLAHLRGVQPRVAGRIAAFGVGLALLFFGTDVLEAKAGQTAARAVAHGPYTPAAGGTYWHNCWWGLAYYVEHEGLSPLYLNKQMPRPGDLLAVHDVKLLLDTLNQHPEIVLELIDTVVVDDHFPLRTLQGYYIGRTPLESQRDGRLRVFVYRITAVPNPPPQ